MPELAQLRDQIAANEASTAHHQNPPGTTAAISSFKLDQVKGRSTVTDLNGLGHSLTSLMARVSLQAGNPPLQSLLHRLPLAWPRGLSFNAAPEQPKAQSFLTTPSPPQKKNNNNKKQISLPEGSGIAAYSPSPVMIKLPSPNCRPADLSCKRGTTSKRQPIDPTDCQCLS